MCFFKLNISTYIIKENAFIFSIFVFNQVLSDFNNCLMICSVIVTKKEELCKRVNTLSQLYCSSYDLVGMSAPLRNVTSCFIFLISRKSRSAIRSILSISRGGKKARCNWHFLSCKRLARCKTPACRKHSDTTAHKVQCGLAACCWQN